MKQSTVQWELALQAALRQCMDAVVRAGNADAALLAESRRGEQLEKKQLSNVLSVAEESHSLPVVTNFIRYQMGRERIGPAWRYNNFGLQVVEQIESPHGIVSCQATQVMSLLRDQCPDLPAGVGDQVRYELMRHYLGYLQRAFVYGRKGPEGAWQELRDAGKEA